MVASVGDAVASSTSDAVANPAGVEVTASIGTASATGDAIVVPGGVEMVAAVGTAVASGDALDGNAFPDGVEMVASVGDAVASSAEAAVQGGGKPSRIPGAWVTAGHDYGRPMTKHGQAKPTGVRSVSAVGHVTAFGTETGIAQPFGVSVTARVGTVDASGVQNLEDDVLAVLLLAA
jgi:hypothetical protein